MVTASRQRAILLRAMSLHHDIQKMWARWTLGVGIFAIVLSAIAAVSDAMVLYRLQEMLGTGLQAENAISLARLEDFAEARLSVPSNELLIPAPLAWTITYIITPSRSTMTNT